MKLTITTVFTGFLVVANIASADDKKAEPKAGATGSLTLKGKTYPLANALAYETVRFDKKRTVIYLSEKALDVAKLSASFKKSGNDEDFFPFSPYVRLVFDDKGGFFQLQLYAEGANVILQGDPNVKADATIKDGSARGTAKMVKPDNGDTFEVTFEVKLTKP